MAFSKLFLLGLLLITAARVSLITGQQVGVSLKLRGVIIPSDSLVDFEDTLYTTNNNQNPTNGNGHDQTLVCETDLVDCCESPVRGNWYLPNGDVVSNTGSGIFHSNRGQNENINGQPFNGSVRIFKRYTPSERGRFLCELPNAANVNQILYANIVNFGAEFTDPPVPISPSRTSTVTAGETYSLMCSALLFQPVPLPSNVPIPAFEWFFGSNGNAPLPSGVTAMGTATSSTSTSITYTSTLRFSPLNQSHTGLYTCRIGAGILANSSMVTVNRPPTSIRITATLNEPLMVGPTGNILTCDVSGTDNLTPMITYQWTRINGSAQTPVGNSNTLTFFPLRLSNAGDYDCNVTISSTLLNSPIPNSVANLQRVEMIQIPAPQSVTVTSSRGTTVVNGSDVTLTCSVQMNEYVLPSELSLLTVVAQLTGPDGTMLSLSSPNTSGITYHFDTTVNSFGDSNVGNYTCTATVTPGPTATLLTGMGQLESDPVEIMIGIPPTTQPPDTSTNTKNSVNTFRCTNEIAITVMATSLIECLLAAPIVVAVVALCWKRSQRKPQYKSDITAIQGGGVKEDIYEEPDKIATTTAPGNFALIDCPAYGTTNKLQPHTPATEAQSSDYEL